MPSSVAPATSVIVSLNASEKEEKEDGVQQSQLDNSQEEQYFENAHYD
ncbi:hypothetical protein FF38_00946 [Lucilia cuprina]|uniref:Uncharacterized protein n=1 Tax=Lucilia cuprina TaxID=7375 RepID=A0A0L0BRT3_LUCCU|nr:hypothetical protein FF38_00946 [Lucilia cuprina]